jgi:hypothetical protein
MTNEEIDTMEAGRELDVEIHKALWPRHNIQTFENLDLALWHYCDGSHEKGSSCQWQQIPLYSTDIAAAWQVVEKMQSVTPGGDIHIECLDGEWEVSTCHGAFTPLGADGWRDFSAADTAPLAICRAALKAVSVPA